MVREKLCRNGRNDWHDARRVQILIWKKGRRRKLTEKREKEYLRNESLEAYLREINGNLRMVEDDIVQKEDVSERFPILFVMGPLRSGTTMLMQWLADINHWSGSPSCGVAYPTNLLSRFYEAPIMGSKIQRVLTDEKFNFRNEIMDFSNNKMDYISKNGKTRGALSPNEFWYFWRSYLPFDGNDFCTDDVLDAFPGKLRFCQELNGLANSFGKPFALKGMICDYNLAFLAKLFPKAIFICTHRQPDTNMEAVLEARKRQLGSERSWYSFKIPEYDSLKKLDPVLQAAGQIYYINHNIEKGLEKLEDGRKMKISYEEFCVSPEKYYFELREKVMAQGYALPGEYRGREGFVPSRKENREYQKIYDGFVSGL